MLALLSLDAVSLPLLERLLAAGRLPNLAALRQRGSTLALTAQLPGAAYATLYTGQRLADHGIHFPLQWCATRQAVLPVERRLSCQMQHDSVFMRLARAGRKVLVLDPSECPPHEVPDGVLVSGIQLRSRFSLPEWSRPRRVGARLRRDLGRAARFEETLGKWPPATLLSALDVLCRAPARLAAAARVLLRDDDYDLLWVTFAAAHEAGHVLWDPQVGSAQLEESETRRLQTGLADVYAAVDEAIGTIVAELSDEADIVVYSAKGMGPNCARGDLLPGMLDRVLATPGRGASASPVRRLRENLPGGLRARVATALPDSLVVWLTGRLDTLGRDWGRTRAFVLPCDVHGFVRLNLRGREKHGIVAPGEAEALLQRIEEGLLSFHDIEGGPAVSAVETAVGQAGCGERVDWLPDLIVHWSNSPSALLRGVASERFGKVLRGAMGAGRAGNHCAGDWVTLVPGSARLATACPQPGKLEDIAVTVCSVLDVPHEDLPGRPLMTS